MTIAPGMKAHPVNISAPLSQNRHRGFDLLRVIAIYMVMQIHTGEFEYIGTDGTVLHTAGSWAVGWTNSLLRVCVPLFVMISGFFLFPIGDERKFYKKRFIRVVIPFVVWCVVYAFYYYAQGTNSLRATLLNISHIPLNYGTEVGHLWYARQCKTRPQCAALAVFCGGVKVCHRRTLFS